MSDYDGRNIRICDPWVEETDAHGVDYDDGVGAASSNIGHEGIAVGVAQLSTVRAFKGISVDKDEASAAVGTDAWVDGFEVPAEVSFIQACLRCYCIEWLWVRGCVSD